MKVNVLGSPIALAPGAGSLEVVRRAGRSVVTRAAAASPLRLLTPRNHGSAAWIYAATYGGGLVGGDAVSLDLSVGPGATAMLSTQASTKVYRSPRGTSHTLTATVSSGALLALLPDPVVCFASSTYRQQQRVRLEGDAALVLMDCVSSGRHARGERWCFDRYASRLEVYLDGRLVVLDSIALDPEDGDLPTRLGRFNAIAFIAIAGAGVATCASHALAAVGAMTVEKRSDLVIGGSPIGPEGRDGCIVRLAGVRFEDVAAAARGLLQFLPSRLGDDPWARKW